MKKRPILLTIRQAASSDDDKRLWFHIYSGNNLVEHFYISPPGTKVQHAEDDLSIGHSIKLALASAFELQEEKEGKKEGA